MTLNNCLIKQMEDILMMLFLKEDFLPNLLSVYFFSQVYFGHGFSTGSHDGQAF